MGKVLIIVDVQKKFDDFIQHDLVDSLSAYAEKFDTVYQIWDTHNNTVSPTHSFPGQIDSIPKKFGKKHFSDSVKSFIKEIEDSSKNGRTFKLTDDDGYVVRVKNNHNWFYVNPEIVNLISSLKGKKIILAGGADGECLEDIYQTFLSFGLNTHINKKYTYSAKTTQKDSVDEKFIIPEFVGKKIILENDSNEYQYKKLVFKVNNSDELIKIKEHIKNMFPNNRMKNTIRSVNYPNWFFFDISSVKDISFDIRLTFLDFSSTEEELQRLFDNNDSNEYDPDILTVNDFDIFDSIIIYGERKQSPNYSPKKLIYENNNNINDATEIVVIIKSEEELYKLKEVIKPISIDYNIDYYGDFPCVIYINLDEPRIQWGYHTQQDYLHVVNNNIEDLPLLNGVYKNPFTIDDLDMIKHILKTGEITPIKPNYKPKQFIFENNKINEYPYDKLIIKVNNQEEVNKLLDYFKKTIRKYDIHIIYGDIQFPNWLFFKTELSYHSRLIILSEDPSEEKLNDLLLRNTGNNRYDPDILTLNDLDILGDIIKNGKRKIKPNYKPKQLISENNNDKHNATEIAVIIQTEEELHQLQQVTTTISPKYYVDFIDKFPSIIYYGIHHIHTNWSKHGESLYFAVINNDVPSRDILNGVYEIPFTINDLDMIKHILKTGEITPIKPNYKPKQLISENKNNKNGKII